MAENYIHLIERLVEDCGWEAVIIELMSETAKRPIENFDRLVGLVDAAIIVLDEQGPSLKIKAGR